MTATRILHQLPLFGLLGVLALLSTGCSPAQAVLGTWELDTTAAISGDLQQSMPDLATQFLFMKPEVRIKFEGTGGFVATSKFLGQSHEVQGTWRFVKTDGET